jgi:hypothetical protein
MKEMKRICRHRISEALNRSSDQPTLNGIGHREIVLQWQSWIYLDRLNFEFTHDYEARLQRTEDIEREFSGTMTAVRLPNVDRRLAGSQFA